MLPVVPFWILWTAPWAVYSFALIRGRTPERILATACALRLAYSIFIKPHGAGQMLPLDLALHAVQLVIVIVLALKYDRWWLLVAGAAELLVLATLAAGLVLPLHWWTAGTVLWIWTAIFLGALGAGAWNSSRSRKPPGFGQVMQTT